MRRARPADEPQHHAVERAANGEAADQRADGDGAGRSGLDRGADSGTARIGWIETKGLLGAITIGVGRGERLEHPGRRLRPSAPS